VCFDFLYNFCCSKEKWAKYDKNIYYTHVIYIYIYIIYFVWTAWPWKWRHHDLSKRICSPADTEFYPRRHESSDIAEVWIVIQWMTFVSRLQLSRYDAGKREYVPSAWRGKQQLVPRHLYLSTNLHYVMFVLPLWEPQVPHMNVLCSLFYWTPASKLNGTLNFVLGGADTPEGYEV
jgi:hypothetical protein